MLSPDIGLSLVIFYDRSPHRSTFSGERTISSVSHIAARRPALDALVYHCPPP